MLRKPQILSHANASAASTQVIAAPGTNKRIIIVSVMATAAGSLREDADDGTIVCYCDDQGWAEWNIALGFNKALFTDDSTGGNITVAYYIDSRQQLH